MFKKKKLDIKESERLAKLANYNKNDIKVYTLREKKTRATNGKGKWEITLKDSYGSNETKKIYITNIPLFQNGVSTLQLTAKKASKTICGNKTPDGYKMDEKLILKLILNAISKKNQYSLMQYRRNCGHSLKITVKMDIGNLNDFKNTYTFKKNSAEYYPGIGTWNSRVLGTLDVVLFPFSLISLILSKKSFFSYFVHKSFKATTEELISGDPLNELSNNKRHQSSYLKMKDNGLAQINKSNLNDGDKENNQLFQKNYSSSKQIKQYGVLNSSKTAVPVNGKNSQSPTTENTPLIIEASQGKQY